MVFVYRCNVIPEMIIAPEYCQGSIIPKHCRHWLDSVKDSKACTLFFNAVLCFYNFPPCDPNTSQLLPICSGRCDELHRLFEFCGELTP